MKMAGFLAVLTVLLSIEAFAQTEATDVLGVRYQLRTEEQRQRKAGRLVSSAARRIDWLLRDLQANQLYEQEDGKATAAMNQQLLALSSRSIPAAASHLGRARENVAGAAPHIRQADAAVQEILEEMGKILQETTSVQAEDKILQQLNMLIQAEKGLMEKTQVWGRKVILDRKAAQADTGRL
ncbi:MAG: hypothetical protein GY842_21780, partial [bacterium]|nr:hypothetical protein [bacterium]